MGSKDDDEDHDSSLISETKHHDAGPEAAGVVRGVTRSLLRSPIGRLPRQKLPLRQVAKVSDRVATSYDVWSSAVESSQSSDMDKAASTTQLQESAKSSGKTTSRMARIRAFSFSVVKNSLLGTAVFEAYGNVVSKLTPPREEREIEEHNLVMGKNQEKENASIVDADAYARASLATHCGAGFVAGSVHGVASSFLDRPANAALSLPRYYTMNTIHHSLAHSLLFGSYVATKRVLLAKMHGLDPSAQPYGGGYLAIFGIAGGAAGQIQHVASHYTEQLFGLVNRTTTMRHRLRTLTIPNLRSILGAGPPSAIGFIAFEYGRWLEQI